MTNEAFVYIWTDKITEKKYIGVHRGNPDDGYICSSIHMLKEYKQRPNDFVREIILKGTIDDMRQAEVGLLLSVDAANNAFYYNQHNGIGNVKYHPDLWKGRQHTKASKKKMSDARKQYYNKYGPYKSTLRAQGKIVSEETKAKIRAAHIGKPKSDAQKLKMSKSHKGKKFTKEHKKNMSIAHVKKNKTKYFYEPDETTQ